MREMKDALPELLIDSTTGETAYALARKARENGLICPAIDLLILACARQHGAGLEAGDAHFAALANLE